MKYIDQFHHRIAGRPVRGRLVFLHGVMGGLANWRRITPAFEEDFEVLSFDQRGHGRSFQPATGYRPEDFADDLLLILDELQWNQISLVGHSMGGRNALNFAHRFSHRVKRLVIEDIGPEKSQEAVDRLISLIQSVPTPFHQKLRAKEFFLNEYPDPVVGNYLYSNLEEKDGGTWDWRFSKAGIIESIRAGRAQDRWVEWEGLRIPTLLVRGERSTDLTREVFEECLRRNPITQGAEIKGAGHWVHYDQPELFIQTLQQFLNQ